MSSEKDPYWKLKNGSGGMEDPGDNAATDGCEFPRKRLRSSGSYTDESINSAETSPKKAKVQIDSSFELSEKVQNNHRDNSTSEYEVKTDTVPSDIAVINNIKTSDVASDEADDNVKTIDEVVSDATIDTAPEQTSKTDVLLNKSEEFFKKSVRQQVEELATEQGIDVSFSFLNPQGYDYKIGQRADEGDYSVCLSLTGEDQEQKFHGKGNVPYAALREAYKKAKEFLISTNGEYLSPNKNQDEKPSGECTLGEEEVEEEVENKVEEFNGTGQGLGKDSDVETGDSEVDEVEQEQPKWVHSLENFWDKALASKFPDISVMYSDKDPDGDEEVVECSIGRLVVEGTGNAKEVARENAAQYMFSLIENILENEGTEALKKNITEGEDSQETENGYDTVAHPPFKDETAVETVEDEESYEDYDEDYEEETQPLKTARGVIVEEEIIDSSSDESSHPVPSPQKYPESDHSSPGEQMQNGGEYCLALARVDMPDDRPVVLDVANLARRVKSRMVGQLVNSMKDGEFSDDEEQEGGRFLDMMQQMLTMSSTMPDSIKLKVSELFSRSGMNNASPSLPMPGMQGMMAGMGYAQYQQQMQMYQHQAGYPNMPAGYPGGYPSQKMRLLAGQSAPQIQAPPEPTKPVLPLKNLCQFPMPGAIEGVGSVTVTLEDYKTLQVGTFLNDVIIDFYMKYLQFTQFIEQDKNGVHIFTTFWFSRLTSKPSPIEARKDPVQRRYDRVKRWTRKVNIFEKDFVVVPINENYHWYLCIICYPGMVGSQAMEDNTSCREPARQRNRRRRKDKIKVLKTKMNAKPRKDESDERDEPLASEDEVEHEDDSTDVELWKTKLTVWEKEEALRKVEEHKRLIEMEKQRKEWEERRKEYEEQQRKHYEEQQRLLEEEELRLALEQEEIGDEEENWEEEKYDEDGNPVEEKYDEYGELITDQYDEFGEPIVNDFTEEADMPCVNGGFADSAKYKTSADTASASEVVIPVKARAMAAEWDDWGEDDEEMEQDMPEEDRVIEEAVSGIIFSSMVAHGTELYKTDSGSSTANKLVTTSTVLNSLSVDNKLEVEEESSEHSFFNSMVAHTVVLRKLSFETEVSALKHKIEQDKVALVKTNICKDIPQVDGMVDEEGSGSDDEKEVTEENRDQTDVVLCETSDDKSVEKDKTNGEIKIKDVDEMELNDNVNKDGLDEHANKEFAENDESSMSADDEVTIKNAGGLVGYADTGDDTEAELETDVEKEEFSPVDDDSKEITGEEPVHLEKEVDDERVNSDVNMEANSDSSDTEDYENDENNKPKTVGANHDVRNSDSEIEELDVLEKEETNESQYNSEDPSDRSQSESEGSDESDYEEDIDEDVPIKQPCILVFDSLGGRKERQARLCATLRDFLALEYAEKYPGQQREFSTRTIPGCAPKVPQQPNLTDCGLFLCHNVETFFKNPIQDYTMPITSLKSWFPEAESRMKRRNVAGIIRKLGTEQNQDKLDQLQFPDLIFVEPEKVKPVERYESRNSPGSDGENMEEEYNSEDDFDEGDQERSDRYSSSPDNKNHGKGPVKDDRFSSEEDNSEVETHRYTKSDGLEEKRQKRYRSEDSGSEEDRNSRHYKRRNDRASSSESDRSDDDDFDSSAVYGRPPPRPVQKNDSNLNFDSSPMKKLPPGISISRAVDSNPSRMSSQSRENTPQEQPEITRRLPPGISISRTLNNPPPGLSISREKIAPTVPQPPTVTWQRKIVLEDGAFDVTIEDVSDYSDENEPFDMDEPAYKRTFMKHPVIQNKAEEDPVNSRIARLPPGVSISRGAAIDVAEDMSEDGVSEIHEDEDMAESEDMVNDDVPVTVEGSNTSLELNTSTSMVAHQAALAGIESCLASMVAHQVFRNELQEVASEDSVPQVDGMNDFDSEDEANESSLPAESLPINQEADPAIVPEVVNPREASDNKPEDNSPTTENNPITHEEVDSAAPEEIEQAATNNEEANNIDTEGEPSTDDVDNIDNHGLEEGEELFPADSDVPENHDEIKTGEEFNNDSNGAFDDGSNLQNAEETENVDIDDVVNAEEVYLEAQDSNLPTEEAMYSHDESDMLENGEEIIDDNYVDDLGTEEMVNGMEVLDASAEIIDDGDEEGDGDEGIDDGAEVLDDSTEVYDRDDTDVLDNNQHDDYDYEEGDEDELYEDDSYSYGYSQPPVKRARMSSDAEVVLDSGDEEDIPQVHTVTHPKSMQFQQQPPSSIQSQILAQQQAMLLAQQSQSRPSHQQGMMMSQLQPRGLPPGLSMTQKPQAATHQSLPSRKRKLESAALCIKDGQVYFKSFTLLPPALLTRNATTKSYPNHFNNSYKPAQTNSFSTSKPNLPQNLNPYKSQVAGSNAYKPVLGVHQMTSQLFSHQTGKQQSEAANKGLHHRIRQLPPGIVVQRSEVKEDSRDSVEEDDDEYQSDDPEEVIDGQEEDEDLDIIEESASKDAFSEEEDDEEESDNEVNEQREAFENEDSKEGDMEEDEEMLVAEAENKEIETNSFAEVDVEFEEESVDVQEACEENEKGNGTDLEYKPAEKSSETDLIEGEEVAGEEVAGEEVAAEEKEVAEEDKEVDKCKESQNDVKAAETSE